MALPMRQLLWLAVFVSVGQHIRAQLSVSRFVPNRGGISGDTKIEFQGGGFDDPKVLIGPYECDVDPATISSNSFDCFTRAAADFAVYNVTVTNAATAEAFTSCCFTFSREMSPSLMLVDPSAGPPSSSPTLAGEYTGTLYWYWSSREGSGRVDYVGKIMFGEYHCYFSDQAGSDVFTPSTEYSNQLAYLRQDGAYRLNCDLPNKNNTWTLQSTGNPGLGVAGNLNVSLHFEQDFKNSLATAKAPVYTPARDGTPHMFQLHAQVDSVTPNTGSLAGGSLITIQGSGFPSSLDLFSRKATASITTTNGTQCRIIESSYNTILCVTEPAATAGGSSPGSSSSCSSSSSSSGGLPPGVGAVWPGGLLVGPRGWVYDIFANNRTASMSASQLIQAANWSATAAANSMLLTDRFDGRNYSTPSHMSRGLGFFIAPKTGSYKFTMIGDDMYQLQGMYHNGSAWRLDNLIGTSGPIGSYCSMYEWTCSKSSCNSGLCTSAAVSLQAGQPLLLAVKHWNGPSVGSWQVGVRIPSSKPSFFSIAEVQRVYIPYTQVPHSQVLSVMFRAPADAGIDVVVHVDLAARAAAMGGDATMMNLDDPLALLNDTRIGVNLTIRGAKIPIFPALTSAATLQTSVNTALKAAISNTTVLGVEIIKDNEAATLTYRLLTNRTAFFDDLVSVDITAQLVLLPDQGSSTGSTTSDNSTVRYCLQRSMQPRTISFTSSNGTNSTMVVYEEVWENVTLISGNESTARSVSPSPATTDVAPATPADAVVLAGVSISVSDPLELPPSGGKPQGMWQLILEGQTDGAVDLYWDATTSNLLTALRQLQGSVSARCRNPSLSDNCVWKEGALIGRSWIIWWPVEAQNTVTHFTGRPKPGGYAPDYMLTSSGAEVLAKPPLSGGVEVAFGDYCDTVNVGVLDTAYGVANKLNSLPGIKGATVRIDGNTYNSLFWTITYNAYSNPGKLPLLKIIDQSTLYGNAAPVQVSRLVEGSTDSFYGPIPGELMRQAVDANTFRTVGLAAFPTTLKNATTNTSQQPLALLDVYINNVLSSCGANSDFRSCTFSYSQASTPVVTSISPLSLSAGQSLTVTGAGFPAGNSSASHVWLSGVECGVVSASATQLVCAVGTTTTVGTHEVIVTVDGKGFAQAVPGNTSTIGQQQPAATSSPSAESQAAFVVNVTAAPAAALQITSIQPGTISPQAITQLTLAVTNLPRFVLNDHTGETAAAATPAATVPTTDPWYAAAYGAYATSWSTASDAAGSSAAELPTASCTSWLAVTVGNLSCPIISCQGTSSSANLTVLVPGHLLDPTAAAASAGAGAINAVLSVVHADGSAAVARRRLMALSHPPLLYMPSKPQDSSSGTAEQVNSTDHSQQEQEQSSASGLLEQFVDLVEDSLKSAATAGSSKMSQWAAAVGGAASSASDAAKGLWAQYVGQPRELRRFRHAVRLTTGAEIFSGPGLPADAILTSTKGTSSILTSIKPIRHFYPQQQLLQRSSKRKSSSNSRRRQLLDITDPQTTVIAQASSTVQFSTSGAGVSVREPQEFGLQPYEHTNIVFEVSGIDAAAVLQARIVPLADSVPTDIMEAVLATQPYELPEPPEPVFQPLPLQSPMSPEVASHWVSSSPEASQAPSSPKPTPVSPADPPASASPDPSDNAVPSPSPAPTQEPPYSTPPDASASPSPEPSSAVFASPEPSSPSPEPLEGTPSSPQTSPTAPAEPSPSPEAATGPSSPEPLQESPSPEPSSLQPAASPSDLSPQPTSASPGTQVSSPEPAGTSPIPKPMPESPSPSPLDVSPEASSESSSPDPQSPEPTSPRPEPPSPDSPSPERPNPEPPSPDLPSLDSPSPEPSPDSPSPEPPSPEPPNQNSPSPEPPSPEPPSLNSPSPEPPSSESLIPETSPEPISPSPDPSAESQRRRRLQQDPESPSPDPGSPSIDPQSPSPDTESPSPDPESPSPDPESPSPDPESPSPDPGSPSPDPASTSPDPESPSPDPESPSPDPQSPSPDTESPSPDPESPSPDPESPSPDPESPSPDPASTSPDPESPSPDPDSLSPDPQSPSPDPASPSPDPGSNSPDPASPSPGPGSPSPAPESPSPEPPGLVSNPKMPVSVSELVAAWSDQQYACRNLTVLNGTHVSCQAGPFPHGSYALVVTLSTGVELAAPDMLYSILTITNMSPPLGSIGGGTLLTIVGRGFDACSPASNVVAVPVPVSTSYPNGVVLCDVVSATYTHVRCRTRPHLAANANADDPAARARLPMESPPGAIQVVRCSSTDVSTTTNSSTSNSSVKGYGLSSVDADVTALLCWSDREISALATCTAGNGNGCTFSYSFSATPIVNGVWPPDLFGTTAAALTVLGTFVERQPVQVLLLPAAATPDAIAAAARVVRSGSAGTSNSSRTVSMCLVTQANHTAVECRLPQDLLPGAWQAILMHQNGELSVTNNQAALDASAFPLTPAEAAAMAARPPVFVLRPVLGSISTQWTGVGGGTMINVTLDPGSAPFDTSNPAANQVLIGGVPSTLDPSTLTNHTLSAAAPPVTGRLMAEYWQLPVDSWSLPYFDGLGSAHAHTRVELVAADIGMSWGLCGSSGCSSWGGKGPAALPSSVVDHWAARFSFYLRVPSGGNTTLWITVDDQVMVTVFNLEDTMLLNRTASNGDSIVLPAVPIAGGQLRVVLSYVEYTGSAYLKMTWDGPYPGNGIWARSTIPPQAISLLPTGVPLPLSVQVNGVPAVNNCSQTPGHIAQLPIVTKMFTPTPGTKTYGEAVPIAVPLCEAFVLSLLLGPSIAGPITPNTVNKTGMQLTVPLLVAAGTAASDLVVNIGGKFCDGLQLVNDTGATVNSSSAVVAVLGGATTGAGLLKLKCSAPNLPAGVYTFQLMHNTWGAAGLEPHVANISVTYVPSISLITTGPYSNFSAYGGVTLNITGFGFAPMMQITTALNTSNTTAPMDPGSLTTAVLDHYAVAVTALPLAAPGVLGVPLIPWDLTKPSSVQQLAPKSPPSAADAAAAGLAVAVTSVQAKGATTRCMVTAATETWIACKLQRSNIKLQDAYNLLQISVLGLDNVTRTVTAQAGQMSYMVGTTSVPLVWYVSSVTELSTGSGTLKPYTPASLEVSMVIPSSVAAKALQIYQQSQLDSSNSSSASSPNPSAPPPSPATSSPLPASPPTAGTPSIAAAVFVVCSRRVYQCANPIVVTPAAANFSAYATYQETLKCSLPNTGLPASTVCEAVVELPKLGFSGFVSSKSNAKINVALELIAGSMQPQAGSMAGGQMITIQGLGFDVYNSSAVRVLTKTADKLTSIPLCNTTRVTPTSVTCLTNPAPAAICGNATNGTCSVSIYINPSDASEFAAPTLGSYTYSKVLTPVITCISPIRGSTEGGTLITITGSNLSPIMPVSPSPTAAPTGRKLMRHPSAELSGANRVLQQTLPPEIAVPIRVLVGGVQCTNALQRDASTITCETGKPAAAAKPLGPQTVVVTVEGKGSAAVAGTSSVSYEYVDLWSRRTTWGGFEPPLANDSVVVPAGTTVMLDVSPPRLYTLLIEGTLFVDPTADFIHLQAHYILLRGGTLRAGKSLNESHPGKFTITLWGDKEQARRLPMFGAKVLANLDGTIQLFGAATAVPSWTQLNTTADIGDRSIVVNGLVNWQAGNTIAIAPSSFDARDVDTATITAVTQRADGTSLIALASPLQYTHLGVLRTYAGDPGQHVLDMRAEVIVFERNIVIQGDPSTPSTMFGGHVMSTWSKRTGAGYPTMQLSNVELRQMGQAFQMGRYPIHFHMMNDVSFQSWVANCSVHNSWNRGITIHGTHQVHVRHTTAFATTGHTFFLEDGIETGNVFEGNCGFLTQVSNGMLITDNNPATFWVTNPNNTYIGNHAGGSLEGFDFWYHLEDYPNGPSRTYSICPKYERMGIFKNNLAHSNSFYGLRIHPEFYQKSSCPCCGSWNLKPAVFEGLIGYKNGVNCVVATQVGIIQYHNMTCADSGAGVKMLPVNGKDSGSQYEIIFEVDSRPRTTTPLTEMSGLFNALAVAQTEEGLRGSLVPWPSDRWIAAVTAPQTLLGAWQHHAHMAIVNFTIIGFAGYSHAGSEFRSLEACAHCKDYTGGNTAFTRGLTLLPPSAALAPARTPISSQPDYAKYYDASVVRPRLFNWSWAHQGIFVDTDGSLLNTATVSAPSGVSGGAWSLTDCRSILGASASFAVGAQPMPLGGCSAHSSHENQLFRPAECHSLINENGVICKPGITFRRVMLNNHVPQALAFRDLIVRDIETNTTAISHQSKYNEQGYVFTAAVGRSYWVHWVIPYRLDPARFTLFKMDMLSPDSWLYIQSKHVIAAVSFAVNGVEQDSLLALPDPLNSTTGAVYYSRTSVLNKFYSWNGTSYNDTTATMLVAGASDSSLTLQPLSCAGGAVTCDTLGVPLTQDLRNGTLYWSDDATWAGSNAAGGAKPVEGSNVNIPFGWNLVIDESPPPLGRLLIEGNVTFSSRRDISLTAAAIIVRSNGTLMAGTPTVPHPRKVEVLLAGNRNSSNILISRAVNAGAKVLAAVGGGTIGLYGVPVGVRWSQMAATAAAGSTYLLVAGTHLGWSVGGKVTVTTSSYNWAQAESRSIMSVVEYPSAAALTAAGFGGMSGAVVYDNVAAATAAPGTTSSSSVGSGPRQYNVTLLTLDQQLGFTHYARISNWDGLIVDLRPEVAYTSSDISIKAADGPWQWDGDGGEKFGVRVLANGPSLLQLDNVMVAYCGQAGLGRPCVHFDRLMPLKNGSRAANISTASIAAGRRPAAADAVAAAGLGLGLNPSFINGSAVVGVMDLAVWISSADNPYFGDLGPEGNGSYAAAVISGNALGGSLDVDTVRVDVRGAVVVDNVGWGTVKDMSGKSKFDNLLPATFRVTINDVILRRNTAAGSERLGFYLAGEPCSTLAAAKNPTTAAAAALRVVNNTAHSSLVGLMLEANDEFELCSGAVGFTLWRNWDYGVFTVKGITTSVTLIDVLVAETKHVGVLVLYMGALADPVEVQVHRVGFVGISGPEACSICNGSTPMSGGTTSDPSCHQKLSRQSYNRETPFTAAVGLASLTFALLISPGPEFKPWDAVKGYPTVLGITRVQGAVFGGYAGPGACAGSGVQHPGAYAIGNHPKEPDAFHPMYFSGVQLPGSNRSSGLLLSTPPDPAWLNEGDCADKAWNLSLPCCSSVQKVDMFAKNIDPTSPPPNLLPINCAGPRHVLLRDLDGSLSGTGISNTTILGGYTKQRAPGGVDTGAMVLPGVCSHRSSWGAYVCLPGQQTSGLANGWKPDPIPATGIMGDPQFFVLESRDDDRETSVFDPVIFSLPGSGQVDLVTNAMDQGCCFGYGFCQKRLNAFWTVLPTGHTVTVNFTGSPGRFWRVWLPYADPSAQLLLQFHFGDVVDRRYLYSPAAGRLPPVASDKPPTLTDGSPGGSYFWDQVSMTFTLKMSGGDMFEIRTESVLYITPKLAMSVDDFYAQQTTFISSLASVLGINPSRIRVVRVVAGSAVVDVEIGEEAQPLPETPFNMTYNMDLDSSVAAAATIAQQVATGQATYPVDLSGNPTYFPPPPAPTPATTTTSTSSDVLTAGDYSTTDSSIAPAPAPAPPPAPPAAPTPSPSPSPSNAAAACTGSAAGACELGVVYLALTTALASGAAELGLGVPIQAITAQIQTSDDITRQAVNAAIIAQAASQGVALPPLIDPNVPTTDLTNLAQQGREIIQTAPPPTTPQAPAPPADAPSTGTTPSAPPGTPPGAPGAAPPGDVYPGGTPPAGSAPGDTSDTQPPSRPLSKLSMDFKAVGIGSAFAGLVLVGAAAFVVTARKRRRLTPSAFTDLSSIATGPSDQARVARQVSRRHRGHATAGGGAAPELQSLVNRPQFGNAGTSAAAAGGFRAELETSPRAKAALGRSLKSILSGKWGLKAARSGDGGEQSSEDERVVLPGSVAARDGGKISGSGSVAALVQGVGDDGNKVVGSPRVQPSITTRDSLRQRHGQQQHEGAEGLLPTAALGGQVVGAAAAGVVPTAGTAAQQQHEERKPPDGGRGRQKLPPVEGRWKP